MHCPGTGKQGVMDPDGLTAVFNHMCKHTPKDASCQTVMLMYNGLHLRSRGMSVGGASRFPEPSPGSAEDSFCVARLFCSAGYGKYLKDVKQHRALSAPF